MAAARERLMMKRLSFAYNFGRFIFFLTSVTAGLFFLVGWALRLSRLLWSFPFSRQPNKSSLTNRKEGLWRRRWSWRSGWKLWPENFHLKLLPSSNASSSSCFLLIQHSSPSWVYSSLLTSDVYVQHVHREKTVNLMELCWIIIENYRTSCHRLTFISFIEVNLWTSWFSLITFILFFGTYLISCLVSLAPEVRQPLRSVKEKYNESYKNHS